MPVIGIRCSPKKITYVILNGNQSEPHKISEGVINFPQDMGWSETLSWLRKQIHEILDSFDITSTSLKQH